VLGEIGQRDGMSDNRRLTKLYDEVVEARGEVERGARVGRRPRRGGRPSRCAEPR